MPWRPKRRKLTHTRSDSQRRGTRQQRGYTDAWLRAAARFRRRNPFCAECRRQGRRGVLGEVVDHVIPHRGNEDLFWDADNWQTLCKPCHDRKTGQGK